MNKKVLIVEDDDLMLHMLSSTMRSEGFSVFEAMDGREAIDVALRECPDIILLDIIIPEIDGIEVFKRLKKSGCCKDKVIIIMTNLEETEAITEVLKEGKCDFIIKTNWNISDIVKKVKGHLNIEK